MKWTNIIMTKNQYDTFLEVIKRLSYNPDHLHILNHHTPPVVVISKLDKAEYHVAISPNAYDLLVRLQPELQVSTEIFESDPPSDVGTMTGFKFNFGSKAHYLQMVTDKDDDRLI